MLGIDQEIKRLKSVNRSKSIHYVILTRIFYLRQGGFALLPIGFAVPVGFEFWTAEGDALPLDVFCFRSVGETLCVLVALPIVNETEPITLKWKSVNFNNLTKRVRDPTLITNTQVWYGIQAFI